MTGSRDQRRDEILDVAVALLAERGYRDTSMLLVARRASASKETLYAWFSDKRGLFEAVIRRNAQSVQTVLARHLEEELPVRTALIDFGSALLELLLGESAVAINRAAISEVKSDPELAEILVSTGREATLPLFVRYLEGRRALGELGFDDPAEAAGDFLGLLLGDAQVGRLLGRTAAPTRRAVARRAERAADLFLRLYAG